MFTKEVLDENKTKEEEWQKKCSAMLEGKELKITTSSGIELKPVYTPADIMRMDYKEIGLPGEYPLTRGNYPLHYQVTPLMMTHIYGYGTAKETRERREWLAKLGSRLHVGREEYIFAIDLPTQSGLDPDEPEARGKVGDCGISISTLKDLEILFEGLPLEKVLTMFIAFDGVLPVTALYAAYALDIQREPLERLFMIHCNLFHHQWFWDTRAFPPRTALKFSTELIKWHIENNPQSFPGLIDGYNVAEAGATIVQEAAFNLAHTIASVEECIKVGLDPDDVAPKFWGHPHITLSFFEEIAKLRAMRRLWAKIFKERFGCKKPESLQYKPWSLQTGGVEFTAQEPLNNIIRGTIMALAGMLADVDGCCISTYDEALGIPAEEAHQVSIRTCQILAEETDIPKVTDPLGGSYYVEWLTNRMEEEINKLLQKMEEMGGYLKCWELGWIRREVEKSAYQRLQRLDRGEQVKVGVNKYRVEETSKIRAFRRPPGVEEATIEKLKKYRQERDNMRAQVALDKVRKAAISIDKDWPESCGVLMPALVEAARAHATIGEMHRILRETFGFDYYSG